MQNDAQVRAAEMREATDDCTTKIRTQLSADASALNDDVTAGLASTNQLIKILSGEESSEESSTSESVSDIFVPSYKPEWPICFSLLRNMAYLISYPL